MFNGSSFIIPSMEQAAFSLFVKRSKMRIIHIIPSLTIGGAERLVFDICNELNSKVNIEVRLITLREENDFGERDFIAYIPASIHLSLCKKNKFHIAQLQKEIESFRPNIIHSHLFMAEIVSRSCLYKDALWFSHFHDNMPQLKKLSINELFSKANITNYYEKRYLYKRYKKNGSNSFIAISQDALNFASNVVPDNGQVHYLKNAISYKEFFNPIRKLDSNKQIKLVNIGNFQKKKNQQFLIEVVDILVKKGISCSLSCLGDGGDRKHVQKKANDYGLEAKISFEGNVTNVKDYLLESTIYVHSAYYEPFGLVLLEAMAAGLPVVCLNGGGNADIVEDGVNGFMIDEQNPVTFAERIEALMNDEKLYESIARNGQATAEKYGMESYCKQLLKLYSL